MTVNKSVLLKSIFDRIFRIRTIIIYLSIAALMFSTSPVSALSQADIDAINQDSVHYKLGGTGNPGSCSAGSLPILVGSDTASKIFNYLTSKGLSPAQAQGVVGNLAGESSLMPNRKQGNGIQTFSSYEQIQPDTGFGLAQWTSAGRQTEWIKSAIRSTGLSVKSDIKNYTLTEKAIISAAVLSLEVQVQYLYQELENNAGYGLAELKAAQDVRQATWIFLAFFERPASVVNAGLAANPTQPTSGPAKEALDEREALANEAGGDGAGSACGFITGNLNGGTGEPSFDAIPEIAVDESPPGAHQESNCTGTFTPGAASLQKLVSEIWIPPVTSVGGYSCRSIVGGSQTSIHGLGRAIDIMIDSNTTKGRQTGDLIRNFLINNAKALGVQRVIWVQHTWSADQNGWRPYTGENPHTDHLHVEINIAASQNPDLAGGDITE